MNIENIFGLHKNVPLKCGNLIVKEWWLSPSQDESESLIRPKHCQQYMNSLWCLKDCKLLLRPITEITDEHGEILEDYFVKGDDERKNKIEGWNYDENLHGFIVYFGNEGYGVLYDGFEMWLLLASLGYDIGIVPNEYKEII